MSIQKQVDSKTSPSESQSSEGEDWKRILVAIDGSENSVRAGKRAISLAKDYNAELIVLHVVAVPSSIVDSENALAKLEAEASAWIDAVESQARKEGVKVKREMLRSSSSVVKAITEHSQLENVDVIVIGTRGLGGFRKLVIGSVSMGVVQHAACSVLVIR